MNVENRPAKPSVHRDFPLWLPRVCGLIVVLVLVSHHFWHLAWFSKDESRVITIAKPNLPSEVVGFDYSDLEMAFTHFQFDSDGNLVIDSGTQASLNAAAEQLPIAAPTLLERISFLIHKQMPAAHATQVDALFRHYLSYHFAERAMSAQLAKPSSLQQEIEQFEQLNALQDRTLGLAMANRLFGDYRRLARLMFASRQLDANPALTREQKQKQLRELQAVIYGSGDAHE